MKTAIILLAAGKGTRMNSEIPKVLHPIAGQSMILHSLEAVRALSDQPPVVVVGHQAESVQQAVGDAAKFVVQGEQLGTGHAVMQATAALKGKSDLVVVAYADMPLLQGETIRQLVQTQVENDGALSMLTMIDEQPRGFGRILRDGSGNVTAIVEEAAASPEQLQIKELNVGCYCFRADWLWNNLERIPLSAKGEYYLTDMIEIARQDGLAVKATIMEDNQEALGINTRVHLAEAESAMRQRINEKWMLAGVTMVDPATTYIEAGVTIGQDTVIYPNTHLQGETRIGQHSQIGPNAVVVDTVIGDHCRIQASLLEQAEVGDHVDIGPFGHLRKGAHLMEGVHMGNFGEIKNSTLGPGVKMGHFSYIGDATIGKDVNIGAGTITCNYDGEKKHKTEIGEGVFIGSDTMLVAPVKLGKGSRTGAGSVVTKDVEENTIVVGVPARAIRRKKEKK